MGIKTKIDWCDSTVNELVGCDGCELHRKGSADSHCYAAGLVGRYAGLPGWPVSFDTPAVIRGRLAKAIQWPDLTGKPREGKPWLNGFPRIIFVSDLSDPFTESVDPGTWLTAKLPAMAASPHVYILLTKRGRRMLAYWRAHEIPRNVWQGVSVTAPETLGRVTDLLQVPAAAVRFISMEPLLGDVDMHDTPRAVDLPGKAGDRLLHWVIVGAESGTRARRMDMDWARRVRDECIETETAFFLKQVFDERGRKLPAAIDGREWHEMPEVGCRIG